MSLRARLTLAVVLLALGPAALAGVLSRRVIARAFDVGVNEQVDTALESGLAAVRREHRIARAALQDDAARLAAWLRGAGRGPEADWKAVAEPGRGDHVGVRDRAGGWEFRHGAPDPTAEAEDGDVPTRFSSEVDLGDGRTLVWVRETDPTWRGDATRLSSTLQALRGLRTQREAWERSFWIPFLLVYLVALVLGILGAIRLARGITDPVDRLVVGTDAVARGERDVVVGGSAGGELGHLTGRFNDMVRTLDAQSRRLIDLETMAGWREMARALAHEVKNPLTPIQLTVEEIRERYRGDDPAYRDLLEECTRIVVEEVESLRSVVGRFREFSRPVELERARVDLVPLVRDVGLLQRDLDLELDLPEHPLPVDADADRLRQLLMNLCANARAAMESSPDRKLALGARAEGDRVRVVVEDSGPGIPPADRERVFEPYRTGSGGLGLGLALVKGIVLAHDGAIQVEESRWGGASIVIDLPAPKPEEAKA